MPLLSFLPVYGDYAPAPLSVLMPVAFVLGIVIVVLAFGLAVAQRRWRVLDCITRRSIKPLFLIVWLFAFAVYLTGMYTGSPWSILGNAPMAVLHAFGVFLLSSDVSAITQPFLGSWVFMACFALAHFLAAGVSLLFVVKHFGFHIMAAARLWFTEHWGKAVDTTYVFWGSTQPHFLLAEDVKRWHEAKGDHSYRIVMVRTSDDDTNDTSSVERMLGVLSICENNMNRLRRLDCLTTTVLTGDAPTFHLLRKTRSRLHIFCLSPDEEANLSTAREISKMANLLKWAAEDKKRQVVIDCAARRNMTNAVAEDAPVAPNIETRIVDTSHLSIELVKSKGELHPVNFVDIAHDATVKSSFEALVVGCGEVGQDAVKFLYEFGAFVKSGGEKVERSPFTCHVVDPEIKRSSGNLIFNNPSIVLHNENAQSIEYCKMLKQWMGTLRYIVLATGNDELNMNLALQAFDYAVKARRNPEKLCILVRINHDDNGRFLRTAQHYNRLWLSHQKANGGLHQKEVKKTHIASGPIHLFGQDTELFTREMIICEKITEDAKAYKAAYDRRFEKNPTSWDDERRELMELNNEDFSPTLGGVRRWRRVKSQNFENCYHKFTKQKLAEGIVFPPLSRATNTTRYVLIDGSEPAPVITHVRHVLAQTEHLRWVASHEMMGFVQCGEDGKKDEARMIHNCMVPWEELSEEAQSYDCNVVDLSLS